MEFWDERWALQEHVIVEWKVEHTESWTRSRVFERAHGSSTSTWEFEEHTHEKRRDGSYEGMRDDHEYLHWGFLKGVAV